ncbi:hypothetical protein FSP39_015527 [Pinctada imbricata]|uniref:LRRCT domain-containing protein n=1 Tax=Pinctada imbricata TaxID=66713 RepID=A0AA89BXI4_PINIB|nr:hypothetical protein FSP39_015527 [Pinctada imbricata]
MKAIVTFVILAQILMDLAYSEHCPKHCECRIDLNNDLNVYCSNTGGIIPKGIPKETVFLDLGGNGLTSVHVEDLQGLDILKTLSLVGNRLSGNVIEHGALELPMLTSVDLTNNRYTSIPPNLPSRVSSLYIGSNPISSLDPSSFRNYTSLTDVELTYTHLVKIYPHTFDMLPKLETAILSFTPIANAGLPEDVFFKNTKLKTLRFRFTNVTSPLQNLPASLQTLDYVGSNIQVLPSYTFRNLQNLEEYDHFNNHLATIEDNAFQGLEKLIVLDIRIGKISSTITNKTLSGLKSVESVYLANHRIPKVEVGALRDLKNLDTLWLSANNLRTLDEGILSSDFVPKLKTLYIDSNPWYCDCHLKWLREKVVNSSLIVMSPQFIKCYGPPKLAGKSWDVLQPQDFVC